MVEESEKNGDLLCQNLDDTFSQARRREKNTMPQCIWCYKDIYLLKAKQSDIYVQQTYLLYVVKYIVK